MTKKHHDHQHADHGSRPHPLAHFFQCCLGDEPAPISPKIQELRKVHYAEPQTEEISLEKIKSKEIPLNQDLIVGDLITHFPQIKEYLNELHPLGLLSPALNQTTLEMFLLDLNYDQQRLQEIYQELNQLI